MRVTEVGVCCDAIFTREEAVRDKARVADAAHYTLTQQGREAIDTWDRCDCTMVLTPAGVECRQCGTLYGTLAQISVAKPAAGGYD